MRGEMTAPVCTTHMVIYRQHDGVQMHYTEWDITSVDTDSVFMSCWHLHLKDSTVMQ